MILRPSRRRCRRCAGPLETCQKRVCQPCLKASGASQRKCTVCGVPFYGCTSARHCPACLHVRALQAKYARAAARREAAGLPCGRKALSTKTVRRRGEGPHHRWLVCFTCGGEHYSGREAVRRQPCASLRTSLIQKLYRLGCKDRVAIANRIERTEGRQGLRLAVGLPIEETKSERNQRAPLVRERRASRCA